MNDAVIIIVTMVSSLIVMIYYHIRSHKLARDIKSAIENQGGETHAEIRAARNEITKRLEAAAVQFDLRVKGKKAKK